MFIDLALVLVSLKDASMTWTFFVQVVRGRPGGRLQFWYATNGKC